MNRLIVLIGTPVCRVGDLKGDRMKAIELSGLEGFKSLRVADVEKPKPAAKVGRALLERGESSIRRAVIPRSGAFVLPQTSFCPVLTVIN